MTGIVERFLGTRAYTETLAQPLSPEDQQLQVMASASPTKWHRAHTTWFFETFLLGPRGIPVYEPSWGTLFNSYYEAVGPRHARFERGILSRPTCAEIASFRRVVDEKVVDLAEREDCTAILELGIAHEQQHQELILTDILAAFDRNPLRPIYDRAFPVPERVGGDPGWVEHPGGHARIGLDAKGFGEAEAANPKGFAFDNEGPAHDVWLRPFALATRLVTVGEWAAFAEDGGYRTPSLWLSDGLDLVRSQGIEAPAYTRREGGRVVVYGLSGEREAHPDEPVLHLSFYEADALATWLDARLPTEAEWECSAFDPRIRQRDDTAWQWTRSSYEPYPGFRAVSGALGEYNGKFMVNQRVLRGGSRFTPPGHLRPTYRNFWAPDTRFQVTGLRIARDV